MRVDLFFLYAFGFMIGLSALMLYFVQRSIGPLEYPPAFTWDPAWFKANRSFNDSKRLVAAHGPELTLEPSYAYTFNLQELKQPIIDVIRNVGWEYRPVLTFFSRSAGRRT